MKAVVSTWLQRMAVVLVIGIPWRAFGEMEALWQPELWFPVGECLTYQIYWGFLSVGETRITTEWIQEDERDLVAIRITTRSNAVLDRLYPVDDFIESVIDPEQFLPIRFTKRLSEGRYRLHEVTTFNHATGTAHWQHLLRKESEETFAIKPDTRDIVSFMYYLRSVGFDPYKSYAYQVMADEKLYDVIIDSGGIERVALSAFGDVSSFKMEPKAKFQGLFVRVGRMFAWVTDDQRCLCAKLLARVPVGSVRMVLTKVEGPGDDFWADPHHRTYQSGFNPRSKEDVSED